MKDKQIEAHYEREQHLKQWIQALDAAIEHLVRFNPANGSTLALDEMVEVIELLDGHKEYAEEELYHVRGCILENHMKQSTKSAS